MIARESSKFSFHLYINERGNTMVDTLYVSKLYIIESSKRGSSTITNIEYDIQY